MSCLPNVSLPSVLCLLQSSHLAVIDALMAVAAMETVAAARTGTADLLGAGCSWEDALLHWVNVVRRKPQTINAWFRHMLVVYPVMSQFCHDCVTAIIQGPFNYNFTGIFLFLLFMFDSTRVSVLTYFVFLDFS